jgi:predicted lipid-binding transport protein (Tim44 family)
MVCLMLGIALAAILIHVFMFPMIGGIVVAAGFLLLGIALGVRIFRRVSAENPPVIDYIIKTRLDEVSMYEENAFPEQSDQRGCDGCS